MKFRYACFSTLVLSLAIVAEPVPVRHVQGAVHGFLNIRSQAGTIIGYGEFIQFATGDHINTRTTLHFRDGSIDDETAIFTQHETLQFVSDHHIQHGPFFKTALESTIDASGNVTIHTTGKDGKQKDETSHIDLPNDLSNGILGALLSNLPPDGHALTLGMVLPIGKGRLIKLDVAADGTTPFTVITGVRRTANLFRVRLDLGGIAGVIAPMVGKQPANIKIWILEGDAPVIVREDAQIAEDAPIISIQLGGTSFPRDVPAK